MYMMDWNEKIQNHRRKTIYYFKDKVNSGWVKVVFSWMKINFKVDNSYIKWQNMLNIVHKKAL